MIISRKQVPLLLFITGVALLVVVMNIPATRGLIAGIDGLGYFGALIAGLLYAEGLTAPTATLIFVQMPDSLNEFGLAVFGGIGALVYDLEIFVLFRRASHTNFIETIKARLTGRHSLPRWLLLLAGAIILASPLPDEMAAGLLGLSTIKVQWFLAASFILNTLGILAIIAIT